MFFLVCFVCKIKWQRIPQCLVRILAFYRRAGCSPLLRVLVTILLQVSKMFFFFILMECRVSFQSRESFEDSYAFIPQVYSVFSQISQGKTSGILPVIWFWNTFWNSFRETFRNFIKNYQKKLSKNPPQWFF